VNKINVSGMPNTA